MSFKLYIVIWNKIKLEKYATGYKDLKKKRIKYDITDRLRFDHVT